jgi:gliding motility-associated-like protein
MNAKWYVIAILIGLLSIKEANAQYLSVRGHFEIDQILGCHDLTVTVTNINPGICADPPCAISYRFEGKNSATTDNPVFTYTAPDTVAIYQNIQGPSGEREDSIKIIIVAPELPNVELLSCNAFEVLVNINDSYYDIYEINYGDGTIIQVNKNNLVPPHTYVDNNTRTVSVTGLFTTASNRCGITSISFTPTTFVQPAQIDSLIALSNSMLKLDFQLPPNSDNKLEVSVNSTTNYVLFKNINQNTLVDTLTNLSIAQNTYCIRIATYDACSNFKSYSNEVCSVDISTGSQNNQITIDWKTLDLGSGQTTNIIRDGNLLQSVAMPMLQHVDSTVICNNLYCYQAQVSFFGGATSHSLEICETAFSTDTPPIIENISSITNADSIEWFWDAPANNVASYYVVNTINEGGNIIKSDSVGISTYRNFFGESIKFIAIEVHDICDNSSANGNVASNIFLEGSVNKSLDIELTWNNYIGWTDGFQAYYITIKDTQGTLLDSISTGGSTTFSYALTDQVEQSVIFTVWAIPVIDSTKYSRSNILIFERDPVISIPNSFTPNGDGLNDTFNVAGKFIASYEMQVFNRWGEVLFYTNELENGWDGTSNNKKLPVGNYAYWIRIKDLNNNEQIRTGSILILSN